VEFWVMNHYHDGKVAESRIIMDTMSLTQLGVVPGPASNGGDGRNRLSEA